MTQLPIRTFFMMRHGETQANAEGYAAGTFDTPLTEKGRNQARSSCQVFKSLVPSPIMIVHSHLSRAKDTANIINETANLPMMEAVSMAEQCFGDWMGQSWETIHDRIMNGETPPNGESMEMLTSRVMTGLSEILSFPKEPVLIVTHGGVFDALFWNYRCKVDDVKNCHIYRFSPAEAKQPFPWDVWHHDMSEDAPICSQVGVYEV